MLARKELVRRLVEMSKIEPAYKRWHSDVGLLFWYWREEDAESLRQHLSERLKVAPGDIPALLLAVCPMAYGNGRPHRVEFGTSSYETVAGWIDPNLLLAAMRRHFGEVEAERLAYLDRRFTEDERIVREFMYQHNQRSAATTPQTESEEQGEVPGKGSELRGCTAGSEAIRLTCPGTLETDATARSSERAVSVSAIVTRIHPETAIPCLFLAT